MKPTVKKVTIVAESHPWYGESGAVVRTGVSLPLVGLRDEIQLDNGQRVFAKSTDYKRAA